MTEIEENINTKSFVLPDEGLVSLTKLINHLGIERIRELLDVLPPETQIIKIGKLSNSMIQLSELQKCLLAIGVIRKPIPQVEKPVSVIELPPIVKTPMPPIVKIPTPSAIVITDTKNDYVKKTSSKEKLEKEFKRLKKTPLAVEFNDVGE